VLLVGWLGVRCVAYRQIVPYVGDPKPPLTFFVRNASAETLSVTVSSRAYSHALELAPERSLRFTEFAQLPAWAWQGNTPVPVRIEARDASSAVVYCRVHAWRALEVTPRVEIVVGQRVCP
jgi:hypothetical protein